MSAFHFNRRDVSFRHNLLVLSNQKGILVTQDRKNIPFESIRLVLDEVVVADAENRCTVGLAEVEMVVVEIKWNALLAVAKKLMGLKIYDDDMLLSHLADLIDEAVAAIA